MNSMSTMERFEPGLPTPPSGGTGGPKGPSIWARLGGFAYDKRRRVLAAWIVVLIAVFGAVASIGASSESSFESPDSESARGFEILQANFGSAGSFLSGNLVFEAEQGIDDPAVSSVMIELFDEVEAFDEVTITSPYTSLGEQQGLVATDRTVAYATLAFTEDTDELRASEIGGEITELVNEIAIDGLNIEIGGASLSEFEPPESELIGVAFAIIILIVALFGVGIGVGTIQLLTNVMTIPDFATTLGAMIGLGVGIDYALFIVTRYREGTRAGLDPRTAVVTAIDTAGRAVAFAGATVVISLLGMFVMGLAFINGLATGAAVTVAITMAASVTLLPALLGFSASRIEVTRWRGLIMAGSISFALFGVGLGVPIVGIIGLVVAVTTLLLSLVVPGLRAALPEREPRELRDTWSYRWSRFVQRHPWKMAIGVSAFLLFISLPVLGLRLGFGDESTFAEDTTTRQAYELLAEGFGAGSNGPFLLVAEVSSPDQIPVIAGVVEELNNTPGVFEALGPIPSETQDAVLIRVVPETGPQDAATSELVKMLRDEVLPTATAGTGIDVLVTGSVASSIDFSSYLSARLPIFFLAVLTLSFLLLMMVFRSLLVPLKAVIMNLLSIGGAYGIVVVVFQWGWGVSLFGTGNGPIEPFLPMMLFAIVFGLSMDYEVFLLSRVKEEYDKTGDAAESVADGLAATARVITAAAAIMVVVFGSFVLEDARVIKMFGMGLASAVFLDATLVRMLLVPATMELLGEKNWWLPGWLDRILPTLNVEGDTHLIDDAAKVPQNS
ncbi:MAG: RND superfamily putative drug exporter [Ilumatobacter sp.]|jgi:RND superfamily putative drug exporter